MSLIEHYFGQSPMNLTYQHVVDFFAIEREESDKIEFKAYTAGGNEIDKENGIIRSISAFLNSGGSLLIWGAPLGQNTKERQEKIFIGKLSPVNRAIGKDYFISRITDGITPAPNNIFFYTLQEGNSYLYIIEVLPSEYSPHQFQSKYNMRVDGQTKPAPHHYIEALFKKITYPILNGFIILNRLHKDSRYFYLEFTAVIFNMSKMQNEHKAYYRIVTFNGVIFQNSLFPFPNSPYFMKGNEVRAVNPVPTLYYNQPYRFNEILRIDPQQLTNGEFEILFFFAGENSPMQISKYQLQINFQKDSHADLNKLFTQICENKYYHEYSEETGKTEHERISAIIGRKI